MRQIRILTPILLLAALVSGHAQSPIYVPPVQAGGIYVSPTGGNIIQSVTQQVVGGVVQRFNNRQAGRHANRQQLKGAIAETQQAISALNFLNPEAAVPYQTELDAFVGDLRRKKPDYRNAYITAMLTGEVRKIGARAQAEIQQGSRTPPRKPDPYAGNQL